MTELVKLLEKNNACTFELEDIDNIELIIKNYVQSGGTLKSNKINRILLLTHPVECNYLYIYEILLRYGYKFKNNLIVMQLLLFLSYSFKKIHKTDDNIYTGKKKKLYNLYIQLQNLIINNKLIITDDDIDNFNKIEKINIKDLQIDFDKYMLIINDTILSLPILDLQLKKYKL